MADLTPRQIVQELDRYIVGQDAAKRAVAIAIRNRWRRQQLPPDLRKDVTPKNIIMIGPTGVGKTEVSRRLAKLAQAPFIKVEASKFTEVGYVGRDVESIIRELTELAINMVREEEKEKVRVRARELAEERLLDLLLPPVRAERRIQAVGGEPERAVGGGPEVGYVGRDVESISRDLTEIAVNMVREEEKEKVRVRARELAEERVLDLLLPPVRVERRIQAVGGETERAAPTPDESATREKLRRMLREGKLEDRMVEIEVTRPTLTPALRTGERALRPPMLSKCARTV